MIRHVLLPAGTYFGLVFAAGFVLGILRVLLLVPRLGEASAELLEIPVMIAVSFFAARFVVNRFRVKRLATAFATGALALVPLLTLEFILVPAVRGLSLADWYAGRDPVAFAAYLGGLLAFSLMPAAVQALRGRGPRAAQ